MKRIHKRWNAYLDDRLSDGERRDFEHTLADHPDLARETEAWGELRAELRSVESPEPADADDLWRDVRARLPERSPGRRPARAVGWAGALGAAAAALIAVAVWFPGSTPASAPASVEFVDARLPESVPVVYTDADSGWTVVWLSNANLETSNEPL